MKLAPTRLWILRFATAIVLAFGGVAAIAQTTVTLAPIKDNTLYEDVAGTLSNGAGQFLFTGNTGPMAGEVLRRAVLAFDLAAISPDSTILSAELTLTLSRTHANAGPRTVALCRLLSNWGEGASEAGGAEGGGGAAMEDDATWIHTFWDTDLWTTEGGDLAPVPSAFQTVDEAGAYTWGSTAQMVADVQGWLDDPASNFGWLVLGDEKDPQTAKRFNSRENLDDETVPQLTIQYSSLIFADGFESGTTSFWDHAVGEPR